MGSVRESVTGPTRLRACAGSGRRAAGASCPQSTWPSTSIPSTSSGSGKRSDENGSIPRAVGSASARTDGVRTPTISVCSSRQAVSAGMRPRYGCTRQRGRTRVEGRELRDDVDRRRVEADLLLGLPERSGEEVGVLRLGLAAGKPELAAVEAAVVRPHDEHDAQLVLVVPIHGHEHGRRAELGHRASCRRRSSIVSRRRITRRGAVADEDGGRAGDAVVVRRHRERVRAGRRHGEEVAAAR